MTYDREHGPLHKQPPNRYARRLTIPDGVGPYVKIVFAEMRRQGRTYDAVEVASGVLRSTVKAWRKKNAPGLTSIEATINALGWSFVPVPVVEILPPEIVGDLAIIAAKMQARMPETWAALLDVALHQQNNRQLAAARLAEIDAERVEIETERAARKAVRH